MTDDDADPGRRARKREQTADLLADCAFALFEAQGFESVTMEQIATAADVAKGTLYKYFPVKEALLRHRFHADLAAELPALQAEMRALPGCTARLRHFLHRSAARAEATRAYLPHYLHHRLSEPFAGSQPRERSGLDAIFGRLLADGQASGEIRPDLPAALLAMHLEFAYLAAMLHWLATPGLRLEAELDTMLELFLGGAGAPEAK